MASPVVTTGRDPGGSGAPMRPAFLPTPSPPAAAMPPVPMPPMPAEPAPPTATQRLPCYPWSRPGRGLIWLPGCAARRRSRRRLRGALPPRRSLMQRPANASAEDAANSRARAPIAAALNWLMAEAVATSLSPCMPRAGGEDMLGTALRARRLPTPRTGGPRAGHRLAMTPLLQLPAPATPRWVTHSPTGTLHLK